MLTNLNMKNGQNTKYRFKQQKCIVLGTPKKPEKDQEWTYPRQELTLCLRVSRYNLNHKINSGKKNQFNYRVIVLYLYSYSVYTVM